MADTAAPPSSDAAPAAQAPSVTPAVPDWVPDALKGDWGKPDYAEKATKAYADTHAKLSTRNDDFRKQVSAEFEAERAKQRPESPDGYKFEIKPGSDIETFLKQNGVDIAAQMPEGGGDPSLYVLNDQSETVGKFREWCHKHAVPADAFMEMVGHVMVRDVRKAVEMRKAQEDVFAKQDAAEVAKLGPNGQSRKEAAAAGIQAHMVSLLGKEKGEEAGKVLALATCFAGGVEGLEALLGATTGGLTPGGVTDASKNASFETMFPKTAQHYASRG